MLFNSYAFILCFLPLVFAGFFLLARFRQSAAAAWLALASLVFYGYWSVAYIPLLLGSIAVNYVIGERIVASISAQRDSAAGRWLALGVLFDLGLLAYYKYTGFFLGSVAALTGWPAHIPQIVLPLGISFFSFTQIAYLVDTRRGLVKERNPLHYLLFITYFPHLIAGPVLHHKQMMPQFALPQTYRLQAENIAVGLTIFAIGLCKKVVLADTLAEYANPVFELSRHQGVMPWQEAWLGVLAYALQLYFDFSGYSDMAIGLSRLFGVRLPLNFHSPYKATSIVEFWRRWHMTLSQFLRDYLYIALGGNRLGKTRRYINLMLTMLLGGLWHGAGWTFVIWGGLHGIYLVINHLYREYLAVRIAPQHAGMQWLMAGVGWLLTMLAVLLAWVFFRADSAADAWRLLQTMTGSNLPLSVHSVIRHPDDGWQWVAVAGLLAVWAPNTQQIMGYYQPAWDADDSLRTRWMWRPSPLAAVFMGLLLGMSIVSMGAVSEFLYFRF